MDRFVQEVYLRYIKNEINFEEGRNILSQFFAEHFIKNEFEKMILNQDHEFLDVFFQLTMWFERDEVFLGYFHQLITQTWHYRHEMILDSIRSYKSPSSIQYVVQALAMKEINYILNTDTDYPSFVRKCMWILADIKSEESIDQLKKYLLSDNKVIAMFADEQLRWIRGDKGTRYMG